MIPFFKNKKNVENFQPAKLRESVEKLNNPYRGWYKIFYFVLGESMDFELAESRLEETDSLAMVFVDIAALGKESLGGDYEKAVRTILDFFHDHKKDVILRVAYDHEGHGLEREPLNFGIIEKHAVKIAEIVNEYDNIFILQGLMVGNWGEMHSSRFLKDEYLMKIARIYSNCKDTYLAVRRPAQWRALNRTYSKNQTETFENMGIFDDAIFASYTDLGTYSKTGKEECGYQSEWRRSEEMEFLKELGKRNPCGGEVVYGEGYSDNLAIGQIKSEMESMALTYLNIEYDKKVLDKWKNIPSLGKGVWENKSLFEYVEAHLGYRFLVEKATVQKDGDKGITIDLSVVNKGFAPVYKAADVCVEIEDEEGTETHIISEGLNDIFTNESRKISVGFAKKKGVIRVYGRSGNRNIEFANESDGKGKTEIGRLV